MPCLLDRLENQDLAERRLCAEDGRGKRVHIKKKGIALLKKMWPTYAASIESHFGSRQNRVVFCPTLGQNRVVFCPVVVSANHKSAAVAQALNQLCLARVMYQVLHSSANGIPLSAEAKQRHFKTIFLDVRLMARSLGLDLAGLDVADLNRTNAGSVTEQFIGQHLLYRYGQNEKPSLHYWTRQAKNSNAEIDYVIDVGQKVVPTRLAT